MNIDEMSDQEKSVALARLNPEWHVIQRPDYARVCRADRIGAYLFQITKLHNFFTTDDDGNPHLMPFAWRVLNWAASYMPGKHGHKPALYESIQGIDDFHSSPIWHLAPADAQRLWLDKILSLAIDAGMVGQTAVTNEPK